MFSLNNFYVISC